MWFAGDVHAQFELPGTQPKENRIQLGAVRQCVLCHSESAMGANDPTFSWSGGMMAQAARDPVFRAALAISNQDIAGSGEFCLRCHAPSAWLEGRSTPADGSALSEEDLNGVSCALCHRLEDPRDAAAEAFAAKRPPAPGNAMMVVDPANVIRGPYGDDAAARMRPHMVKKSEFLASSELCGTCHNVSNPTLAEDAARQPPHAYGHIERTYSEWLLSDFAKRGAAGTCQSCHYPPVAGGGVASRITSVQREHFVTHGPTGGSTWVQDATWLVWNGKGMDRKALDAAKERARKLLRTAAKLELSRAENGRVRLRIINQTGHKLPTGYPEGRRMWVRMRFLGADGGLIAELGRYGERDDTIFGKPVRVPTLLDADATRIYECLPGMSAERAAAFGKQPGPSFHFVLNDVIVKDNRIPPVGFANAAFAEHQCAPVGATYADGQHWDDVEFDVPAGAARVEAHLVYQSVSWEYIKFLAEENRTDDWGRRLYEAWRKTGMCPPEVIAEAGISLE
ncbi:MAG: hypothetical protein D6744_00960 [Planctomycetota bacterium]|nr:MAG: hypothetical protein D6744_00960 [Planctomycetota bacterium]